MSPFLRMKRAASLWVGATLFFGSGAVLLTEQSFLMLGSTQALFLLTPGWILAVFLGLYAPYSCRKSQPGRTENWGFKHCRKWGWGGLLLVDPLAALWGTFFLLTFNDFPHGATYVLGGATGIAVLGLLGASLVRNWGNTRRAWAVGFWTGVLPFLVVGLSGFGADILTPTGLFVVLILFPTGVPILVTLDLIMVMGPKKADFSLHGSKSSGQETSVEC